jgi:energy-converting hydrogenase Eha subunit G
MSESALSAINTMESLAPVLFFAGFLGLFVCPFVFKLILLMEGVNAPSTPLVDFVFERLYNLKVKEASK